VVVLEDGGNVVRVIVVETAVPLARFSGEEGMKEHVTPASAPRPHVSVTLLAALLCGVTVIIAVPVCPA
jgi:hypothetical protein